MIFLVVMNESDKLMDISKLLERKKLNLEQIATMNSFFEGIVIIFPI